MGQEAIRLGSHRVITSQQTVSSSKQISLNNNLILNDGLQKRVTTNTEKLNPHTIDKTHNTYNSTIHNETNAKAVLFKEGDLFYGLAEPRAKFMRDVVPDLDQRMDRVVNGVIRGGEKTPVIVDTINNQFLGTDRIAATYNKNEKISQKEYEQLYKYQGKLPSENKEVKEFRTFMEGHKKYDPRKISGGDAKSVDIRVGRACKAALEYTTKVKKQNIHFVLDELRTDFIKSDLKESSEDRSITGKEIKWVYRHRNDKELMSHVKFYRNGQEVVAPWEAKDSKGNRVDEFWNNYDEHRASQKEKTSEINPSQADVSSLKSKKTAFINLLNKIENVVFSRGANVRETRYTARG